MFQVFPKQPKTTGDPINITFAPPFNSPPVILVTPFWEGQGEQVGNIETVTATDVKSCQISSSNQGSNYYVNVLAIDPSITGLGFLKAQSGNKAQTQAGSSTVNFRNHLNSNDPVVLLAPCYSGGVGNVQYLFSSAASEIITYTGNNSHNYSYNYLAADRGSTGIPVPPSSLTPLETGTYNKTGGGTFRVYFDTIFTEPPTVFMSPWYDSQSGLGGIETLTSVTTEYFDAISSNAAASFYVNWMAFGATGDIGIGPGEPALTGPSN